MLYENIVSDLKDALVSKNDIKRNCLRMLVSDVKNATVNAGKSITDDAVIGIISKSIKTHNVSIEQFESNGRNDLAEKEREELSYLEGYLPRKMNESELNIAIALILKNVEPLKKNMGVIMKQLGPEADKKMAAALLSKILK